VKEEVERGWMEIKDTNMEEVQGKMEMDTNVSWRNQSMKLQ
jgi:hypothetical protein